MLKSGPGADFAVLAAALDTCIAVLVQVGEELSTPWRLHCRP